ncbi:hypothetical protein LSM04_000219 [Trypanosoma melophagium]|uniref:uncharacterized protein n=1 Tax=Trypanosoma melophagium TaxID=715481 RepID=UPI003519F414|nr:hypothetical protein LSM04_000219 [Trypanosoma melophagium]
MRRWWSAQHASRFMLMLRRDLISTRNTIHSAHTPLWKIRRISTSNSSNLDAESGAVMHNNHNIATSPSDDSPSVMVNLSQSTMSSSSSLSKTLDSKIKHKSNDEDTVTKSWDLQWMLFSLKDNRTGIVSYSDAEDRLRGMVLLDTWMIEKMFLKSGWLNQLQKNEESAPLYRSVVGEYKILRYLLHRFLSDETLWCDELQELLQIILEKGIESQRNALYSTTHLNTVSSYSYKVDDGMMSLKVPHSLLSGPENMNFYSDGLQRVLWNFLQLRKSSLDAPDAAWCAFVATHRNSLFLPSPQRPPFDHCEQIPYLSEAEFADIVREEEEAITTEILENGETLVQGVTLHWPSEWKLENDRPNGQTHNDIVEKQKVGNDHQRHQYQRDAFYMNLVEPNALDFYEVNAVKNTSTSTTSFFSPNVHKQGQQEEKENHVGCLHSSSRTERGLLNPVNGELEDLHLTRLWDAFQGSKMEDIIDLYRGVCGRLETLQEEVFLDCLARKGLLLLFFARDEVRALTSPSVTYQRLRTLHDELEMLVSWYYPYNGIKKMRSPYSFEELSQTSQLSFSCFGYLHAPLQRNMYKLASEATSPAQLYHHYCSLYSQDAEKRQVYPNQDTTEKLRIKKVDSIESHHDMIAVGRFPKFELLSNLQQMAFQYPFKEAFQSRAQSEPVLHFTLSHSTENTLKSGFTDDTIFSINRESSVMVKKRRGRPKKVVRNSDTNETQEPPIAVERRGRPKKVVRDSDTNETQEPPIAVERRGRPKKVVRDSDTNETQEPPIAVERRGRPKKVVRDSDTNETQEPPIAVERRGRPKKVVRDSDTNETQEPPIAVERRGRPKKVVRDSDTNETQEPPIAVERRGRPKKVVRDSDTNETQEPPIAVERRGRPKKVVRDSDTNETQEPPIAVKQGRHRKDYVETI